MGTETGEDDSFAQTEQNQSQSFDGEDNRIRMVPMDPLSQSLGGGSNLLNKATGQENGFRDLNTFLSFLALVLMAMPKIMLLFKNIFVAEIRPKTVICS